MIVLDEQLLSYGLRTPIERWYCGTVTAITQLRPGTIIRDDAMPMLLRVSRRPTFVTINVLDFWRRLTPEARFCIVCVAVLHTRALEVPDLVRCLFALEPFRTRQQWLGKIARMSQRQVQYYTTGRLMIHRLDWPRVRRQGQGCEAVLRLFEFIPGFVSAVSCPRDNGYGLICSRIQEEAWIVVSSAFK